MSQLGLGVMIAMLSSNKDTVEAVKASIGKTIASVVLENDTLNFKFSDGAWLHIDDRGQSCCEHRYMTTDDDLSYYSGSALLDLELAEAPSGTDNKWGDHDCQFLKVKTGNGVFTIVTHVEHNGYYGGFAIEARAGVAQ